MADGDSEEAEKKGRGRLGILKDIAFAFLIVGIVFGGLFAYTQVYPPLVVVESASMQHSDDVSSVGVIDTGDLVLVQSAPTRPTVVTWIEGRVTGHATYGDYGDVIVFRKPNSPSDPTPVIHRALMYIVPNGSDAYDIPDLAGWPLSLRWEGVARGGAPTQSPYGLQSVTIHGMGWQGNLNITFDLLDFKAQDPVNRNVTGYITMGDNNAYDVCAPSRPCGTGVLKPYDFQWVVPQGNILGRARGEIPWFGLLKLTLDPARSGTKCCDGWGDPLAPRNSWDSLTIALPLVFGAPFIVEGGLWAWGKFITPRLRKRRGAKTDQVAAADPVEPR